MAVSIGKEKSIALVLIFSGILLAFVGIGFVSMYIFEAIIKRLGEADQSLIFWYLPILFIGVFISMGSIALIAGGKQKLKNAPKR